MSLLNIFDVAGSAMSAETIRLNVTASNLANAQNVGTTEDTTYRAKQPIFSSMINQLNSNYQSQGVQVDSIIESQTPMDTRYQPDHPLANDEGYVFLPNVNMIDEMANMISASRSYESNVQVMNTSKQLLMATLRMGQ